MLTSPVTAPLIWPAESTSREISSVSDSPNERRASMGGGIVSQVGKSSILGISMAKEALRILENKERNK